MERSEVFDAVAELDFLGFPTLRHRHVVNSDVWEDKEHTGKIAARTQKNDGEYYMTDNAGVYYRSLYKRDRAGNVLSRNRNKAGKKRVQSGFSKFVDSWF